MDSFHALVLSLPTRNSTLRMRLWRALKETGCAVLRDGVYLLPGQQDGAVLQRIDADIRASGGFAMTLELRPGSMEQLADLKRLFDRSAQYGALAESIEAAKAALARLGSRRGLTALRRCEFSTKRLGQIDFFPGQAKLQVTESLAALKSAYERMYGGGEPRSSMRALRQTDAARYQKRIWATRKAPWVDRLASAWLIKRFIDREAKFTWIARPSECPKKAVGFDFDGAQFTHVKNRVTFEVLLAAFGLDKDPGLGPIAAAVHFLDVGGIPVPDAKGLETMLKGAKERARDDDALLAESMRVFDLLHSAYRTAGPT